MYGAPRLYRAADLGRLGLSHRRVRAMIASSALVRVRPGVHADGAEWSRATPEERTVARAHALALCSADAPVFSHETAAAIHGLPLLRPDPLRVHVIAKADRPGAARGVIRHRGVLGEDTCVVDGLTCTTLARTVADVARTADFERSVVVADAALRTLCAARSGDYDAGAAEAFRQDMIRVARRSSHGVARALRTISFSDGRAQLPGESISRIRLRQLGFRLIDLQVPIREASGRPRYFVDFGLDDPGVTALGEFDGSGKYLDPHLTAGRSARAVLDEEKKREDWIRGRTQRRFARWGWTHLGSADTLGQRLREFGIAPPR